MAHANSHGEDKHNDRLLDEFLAQSDWIAGEGEVDDEAVTLPGDLVNEILELMDLSANAYYNGDVVASKSVTLMKKVGHHIKYNLGENHDA